MLLIASIISGAIGGMGIGGGVVLIPVLTSFFDISQKNAQFINLIYFVPLSICALFVHIRAKRVDVKKALFMALGGIAGALLGCEIAARISVDILRKFFGFFLLFVGITRFKNTNKNASEREDVHD